MGLFDSFSSFVGNVAGGISDFGGSIFSTAKAGLGGAADFLSGAGGAIFGGRTPSIARTPGINPNASSGLNFEFGSTLAPAVGGTFDDIRQSPEFAELEEDRGFFDRLFNTVPGATGQGVAGDLVGAAVGLGVSVGADLLKAKLGSGGVIMDGGGSGAAPPTIQLGSGGGGDLVEFDFGGFFDSAVDSVVDAITPGDGDFGTPIEAAFDWVFGDDEPGGFDQLDDGGAPGLPLTAGHTHGNDLEQLQKSKTRQRQYGTWIQGRDWIQANLQGLGITNRNNPNYDKAALQAALKKSGVWMKNKSRWRSAGKQVKRHLRALWDQDFKNEQSWDLIKTLVNPPKRRATSGHSHASHHRKRKTTRRKTTRRKTTRKVSHRRPTTHKHTHKSPSKGHAHKRTHAKRKSHKHSHSKPPTAAQKRVRAAFAKKNRGRKGAARGGRL